MKNILVVAMSLIILAGCSSKPPMPPEPKGPLVKVNSQQPNSVYGETKR